MNRWLFAKQIPCKLSFLYIHTKVMWLPGGQWQSLILRTSLYYSYFCVVRTATGTPKSVALECISQIPLWGCLHPRRHTQWLTTRNQDEVSQHGQTGQRAGSYHMYGVSTGHGIECLWATAALLTLRTLSSPRKLRLHNRVNRAHCPKPRTATKWHARSEFPLLCPFSLPLSEVISFCFILILFSGTWSFAWTQSHTRLKPGCVNAPSYPALKKAQFLYVCTSMAMALSSLEAAVMAFFLQPPPAWLSSSYPQQASSGRWWRHPVSSPISPPYWSSPRSWTQNCFSSLGV